MENYGLKLISKVKKDTLLKIAMIYYMLYGAFYMYRTIDAIVDKGFKVNSILSIAVNSIYILVPILFLSLNGINDSRELKILQIIKYILYLQIGLTIVVLFLGDSSFLELIRGIVCNAGIVYVYTMITDNISRQIKSNIPIGNNFLFAYIVDGYLILNYLLVVLLALRLGISEALLSVLFMITEPIVSIVMLYHYSKITLNK